MIPANTERILEMLDEDALVLDVGGWAAPFNRATHVLDVMPYETRGGLVPGGYGPGPERFTAETWTVRDMCDREPWPWPDDYFDFALCVTTLEDIRDPIWVCSELSRVAKAGYVEVPTILSELVYSRTEACVGHAHHRWLCEIEDGELVFMHKWHSLNGDWRVRVVPRWQEQMTLEDHLQGLFWEGELRARERVVIGHYPTEEIIAKVRERFRPSPLELRLKQLRAEAVPRVTGPLRRAAERALRRRRG